MRPFRPSALLGAAALVLLGAGALWVLIPRSAADPERFLRHRGRIASVAVRDSTAADGRRIRNLEIRSSTGLCVRGRISLPPASGERWPALLLQGGLRTGASALFYVPGPGLIVLASMEYPYRAPPRVGFFRVPGELLRIRDGTERGVAGLLLLLDYLESLPEVDPARTVIAGGSLGAPFAAMAGAIEPRFEGVALLFGGADLAAIARARLPFRSAVLRRISGKLLEPWLDPFDPARFLPRISPRPVLLVNGRQDEEIPPGCVQRLHSSAREPRTVIWVDTPHRVQGNAELTAPVARAVWEWMETWGWRERAPACGS